MKLTEANFWRVKAELMEADLMKEQAKALLNTADAKIEAIMKEFVLDKNKKYKLHVETKEILEVVEG